MEACETEEGLVMLVLIRGEKEKREVAQESDRKLLSSRKSLTL